MEEIHNSWFMLIRKVYLTYSVALAAILLLLVGSSWSMQIVFHYRVVETQRNYSTAYALCVQIALIFIFLLGSFFLSNLLAKCVEVGKIIWEKNQFVAFSRKLSNFVRFGFNTRCPRIIGLLLQIFLVILLEWSPFLIGLIWIIVDGNLETGLQAFLTFGSFTSLLLIVMWWCAGLLENYKRFVLFFIFRKNIFENEEGEPVPEVEPVSQEPTSPADNIEISDEMNIWFIFGWLCCVVNIAPQSLEQKIKFKMKHLWIIIGGIAVLSVLLTLGIFQFWEVFIISMTVSFCLLVDIMLSYAVSIPPHSPQKHRIGKAWNRSYLQRFIVVIEDGFYHSPSLVFSHAKYVSFAIIIIISTCATLQLTQMYYAFFLPLAILGILMSLYILRFNLKSPEVLDPETTPIFSDTITSCYHAPNEHHIFRAASVLFFSFLCVFGSIFLIVWTYVFLGEIPGSGALLMVFMVAFFLFKRHDRHSNDTHIIFFVVLMLLLGVIFTIGNYNQPPLERRQFSQVGVWINETQTPYEICSKSWGGYNIIDYGFFATLAYNDGVYFDRDFNNWFPNCTGCQVVARENTTVSFYDLYIPDRNLSIIGVRGTHLLVDWIQDIDIWKEIGLLQVASLIGPFVSFWPESLTASIVYYIAMFEELLIMNRGHQRFYYQVLEKYVTSIIDKREQIVLTGHSLGGGIASIVAARHNLKSITFNSPGLSFSRYKLDLDQDVLNKATINIIPQNDVVTRIDKAAGVVQHIACKEGWVSCHRMGTSVRELIKTCGSDKLGRWMRG